MMVAPGGVIPSGAVSSERTADAMAQVYRMPQPSGPVADLVPESADGARLTPDTAVLVVNRGRAPLRAKFDGRDYVIPPGEVIMPYGAARHFQQRLIIPGTRNPETGAVQSYLGIRGLDDDWMCLPLTDDECDRYGEAKEAIDRAALTNPVDREVQYVSTGAGRPMPRQGLRPQIDTSVQATPEAHAAAAHIWDRPTESATAADAAEARAFGHVIEADASPADPVEMVAGGGARRRRR